SPSRSGAFASASSTVRHGRGSSASHTFTTSSGCDVGGTSERSSSDTFETASMMSFSCAARRSSSSSESSRRARCATWRSCSRSIAMSFLRFFSITEEAPVGAPSNVVPTGSLDRLDVRGLRALGALHNLERHLLTLGQRLVPVHPDRREVHEDVVPALALDEAVALLVREPFHGALCQLWCLLPANEKRRPRV